MKFLKKAALLSLVAVGSAFGIGACKSNAKMPVTFVAVTSNTYNAEVSIGDYAYKFKGKVDQKSNKFTLEATATGKASSGGQQGGPGGGGPGGGGFPGGGDFPGGGGFPGGDTGGDQGGQEGGFPGGDTSEQPGQSQEGGFPGGEGGFPGQTSEQPTDSSEQQPGFPGGDFPGMGIRALLADDPTPASSEQQPGPGGDFPGPGGETSENPGESQENPFPGPGGEGEGQTSEQPAASSEEVVDYSEHNFVIKGTYEVDKGYGYTLKLEDGFGSIVHTDFDKTEGRHEFYYLVRIGEDSSLVHFQAKDPTFKSSLAKDYQKWDVRDSDYIFYAKATGNNNSLATAYLYLHKDHTAVMNVPSGTQRNISIGLEWKLENDVFTITKDGQQYTSLKSSNAARPGYAIPLDSYTFIYSSNPEVKWKKMDVTDFIGQAQVTFAGEYIDDTPDKRKTEYNLYLCADGSAKLYSGWTQSDVGTWTLADGVYSISMGEGDTAYTSSSKGEGDKVTIEITIWVSMMFSQNKTAKQIELTIVK